MNKDLDKLQKQIKGFQAKMLESIQSRIAELQGETKYLSEKADLAKDFVIIYNVIRKIFPKEEIITCLQFDPESGDGIIRVSIKVPDPEGKNDLEVGTKEMEIYENLITEVVSIKDEIDIINTFNVSIDWVRK